MTMPRSVSPVGLELIMRFEGFPYGGRPYRDPVGIWTRGYGRTEGINARSPRITQTAAARELQQLLTKRYLPAITSLPIELDQNQVDALASFVWNVGPGGVAETTRVGRCLRCGDWHAAADAMLDWDKAGGHVLEGLSRRRHAERALFLKPAANRWEGYTTAERRWITEYDKLKVTDHDEGRRHVLRALMKDQRKQIWRAAQGPGGWTAQNRASRYRSLLARTR